MGNAIFVERYVNQIRATINTNAILSGLILILFSFFIYVSKGWVENRDMALRKIEEAQDLSRLDREAIKSDVRNSQQRMQENATRLNRIEDKIDQALTLLGQHMNKTSVGS